MADNWQILPPWTNEQGPTNILLGSPIRDDFKVIKYPTESEITTSFHWTDLSRQEVANLRNLVSSEALRKLLHTNGYGTSWGTDIDMVSEVDPKTAEFDLMIDSKEDLSQAFIAELASLIKQYRVQ